jgi:integrase
MSTLDSALRDFTDSKKFDVRRSTHQQLSFRLGMFVKFLRKHGCDSPATITREHVNLYQGDLQKFADSTQRQHIMAIKAFLRDQDRDDLARKIKPAKQTPEGIERRKPRPFSDDDIRAFLRVASPRTSLFFRAQLATGLGVSDMVRLRVEHLEQGCVCISRQKTGKPVRVRISDGLYRELLVGLPFWSEERGTRQGGVTVWSREIRNTMCRADIYTPGALTHRCRDSFVDRQLSNGTSLAVIAAALGDLISTVEKHYQSLDSMRMRQQIQQAPVIEIPVTL